jgi:uncharacterized repeat protein (TIGR02543 family)
VTAPATYTVASGDLASPEKSGYTFAGWEVMEKGEDSNLTVGGKIEKTNNTLTGKYGDVTLKALWNVNAKAVWSEYGYAPTGYKLLVVSAVPGDENNGVYFTVDNVDTAMYYLGADSADKYVTKLTNGAYENASGVYLYLIKTTETETPAITIKAGANTTLTFDGIMHGNTLNYNDASIVNEMIIDKTNKGGVFTVEQLSIQRRLQADMNHDGTASADDVNAIVNLIQAAQSGAGSEGTGE